MMKAYTAAFLAWLIPGAGHFYLGKRWRALLYAAVVSSLFVLGFQLEGKVYSVDRSSLLSILALAAELGAGVPFILTKLLSSETGNILSATFEHGTTFLLTAGLMNLILSLDAHDIALGRKP